tara:strand:- start:2478 stop:3215 length:738 start_codon:yes stop_codon:yes gene_type:complete
MNKLIKGLSVIILVTLAQAMCADEITDTYTTGDTLTAATLNTIKEAVNDNDSRITNISLTPGPQGETGATGAQGPTGPEGPLVEPVMYLLQDNGDISGRNFATENGRFVLCDPCNETEYGDKVSRSDITGTDTTNFTQFTLEAGYLYSINFTGVFKCVDCEPDAEMEVWMAWQFCGSDTVFNVLAESKLLMYADTANYSVSLASVISAESFNRCFGFFAFENNSQSGNDIRITDFSVMVSGQKFP